MVLTLGDERILTIEDPLEAERIARAELESSPPLHPLIVSIDDAWNQHIDVGLAGEKGTIQVYTSSNEPPYWVTFNPGASPPEGQEVVVFYLHGRHHTEVPAEHLVPSRLIWPVLGDLLASGVRSKRVEWREV